MNRTVFTRAGVVLALISSPLLLLVPAFVASADTDTTDVTVTVPDNSDVTPSTDQSVDSVAPAPADQSTDAVVATSTDESINTPEAPAVVVGIAPAAPVVAGKKTFISER